ncbi:hypothetical protein BDP27DRAFT_1449841 [Rhodocollybia butyracea]|uniref:Uncharacterized protein n=1 Tax=Rhodocollybia butyracea TaxID=206335 RepID=A0A9P5PN06_9AGAR|nr:hypothetical protein BDP27DRAFT_1449841 [Rhodocollybia butyracea]
MPSSDIGSTSHFFRWCRSLMCSSSAAVNNKENDLHYVPILIKAFKAGTALDGSYDPILKDVMKNAKSRDALLTAVMDNMKLYGSQYMAADFPKAVDWKASDFNVKAATEPSFALKKHLDPPHGTRGFIK